MRRRRGEEHTFTAERLEDKEVYAHQQNEQLVRSIYTEKRKKN